MTKFMKLCAVSLTFASISASSVFAECYCACINNKETKVCENKWDPKGGTYCSGTYCSGSLDLPKLSPFEETIQELYALIDLEKMRPMSQQLNLNN